MCSLWWMDIQEQRTGGALLHRHSHGAGPCMVMARSGQVEERGRGSVAYIRFRVWGLGFRI
jgi:hypothetical protein